MTVARRRQPRGVPAAGTDRAAALKAALGGVGVRRCFLCTLPPAERAVVDEQLTQTGARRRTISAALVGFYGDAITLGNVHHHADYCLRRKG